MCCTCFLLVFHVFHVLFLLKQMKVCTVCTFSECIDWFSERIDYLWIIYAVLYRVVCTYLKQIKSGNLIRQSHLLLKLCHWGIVFGPPIKLFLVWRLLFKFLLFRYPLLKGSLKEYVKCMIFTTSGKKRCYIWLRVMSSSYSIHNLVGHIYAAITGGTRMNTNITAVHSAKQSRRMFPQFMCPPAHSNECGFAYV